MRKGGLTYQLQNTGSQIWSFWLLPASVMYQKMAAAATSHPSLSEADNQDCCICGANLSLPLTPPSADVCFCVNNVRWNNREAMSRRDYQASRTEEEISYKIWSVQR